MSEIVVFGIIIVVGIIWFALRRSKRRPRRSGHYYNDQHMYDNRDSESDSNYFDSGDDGGDDD